MSCQLCQDRGIVLVDNSLAKICQCKEQKRLERLFKSSQITLAFKNKTFSNFDANSCTTVVKDMFGCARNYVMKFERLCQVENNWLVLLGKPGSGKTHLSMAVANNLMAKNVPVLYFPHVEGFNDLMDSFSKKNEENVNSKLKELKTAKVLVWDDLFKGREKPTDWVVEKVFEVLNYRYLNLLPTIISSERIPEQLVGIDEAIGSRIIERGRGFTVVNEDPDSNYRLRGD